ncbi:MAG: hypothetical protein WCX83_02995 [Candidatus Cloacimonas sp.]|nr:hypothetical protein [Candidatus Cloacimonadota bacterium]
MNFFEKLQALDRRWIYLLVALAITIPLVVVFDSKTYTTTPTENIYQLIDSYAGRDDRAIMIDFLHDASTMSELFPMEVAILRHAFQRKVKVFTICFLETAAPLVDYAINTVKEEFPDIQSGVDYINIGYKPGALYLPIVLGMGDDISEAVKTDAEGRQLANLPMMEKIKNYNEMNLVIETSGSGFGASWFVYARPRFGVNVAAGITAVMAADAYPYIQTGQLVGILAGLKGAAEYEKLVDLFAIHDKPFSREIARTTHVSITDDTVPYKFKAARIGMNAQTVVHILIILFIVIGNIGYFIERRRNKELN